MAVKFSTKAILLQFLNAYACVLNYGQVLFWVTLAFVLMINLPFVRPEGSKMVLNLQILCKFTRLDTTC